MQCIRRDDAPFELEQLYQFQSAGNFVVARRQNIGQRHACLRRPCSHHHRWHMAHAAFIASPQSLAVQRYNPVDLHRLGKRPHEALENLLERFRIEQTKDATERVVARYPVLQHQHRAQQRLFLASKKSYVGAVLGSAQRRQQRNEQHLRQIVVPRATARVVQFCKTFRKPFQSRLPSNQETLSESKTRCAAIDWSKFHAIPLRKPGRAAETSKLL